MVTLAQIKQTLANHPSNEFLMSLAKDSRVGAQKLLAHYRQQQLNLQHRQENFEQRLKLERHYWPEYPLIAGIDEVGRGPLAGPVVTCAIILPHNISLLDVNDSKQLSLAKREALFPQLLEIALAVGLGIQDAADIDDHNIYHATELAMGQAVDHLIRKPDLLLVDAMTVPVAIPQVKLIKGDARSVSVAAASIVAKVVRDRLMTMYDQVYPGYDFGQNEGYGTARHLAGLEKLGPSPIHRHSFAPVKKFSS